ncbi:MAG: hypothetical protein ACOCP8_02370, partial [archaeon]
MTTNYYLTYINGGYPYYVEVKKTIINIYRLNEEIKKETRDYYQNGKLRFPPSKMKGKLVHVIENYNKLFAPKKP